MLASTRRTSIRCRPQALTQDEVRGTASIAWSSREAVESLTIGGARRPIKTKPERPARCETPRRSRITR